MAEYSMVNTNKNITELVKKLFPFGYSVTGSENDRAAKLLQQMLSFKFFEYPSGKELNGWVIPEGLKVQKAEIRKNGSLIYDAKKSPLGVPALSESFEGQLTLEELTPHLFTADNTDAIPYHWMKLYRPDEKLWGFCIPKKIKDSLLPGNYKIELKTATYPSKMKVLVYTLQGKSNKKILINAHNCHPYQANDDLSGVAVGIEVMKSLSHNPERKYTYQLMVAPELFGPLFWLDEIGEEQASSIIGTIMLKSVGNKRELRLQESFSGNSLLDRIAHQIFKLNYGEYKSGAFRTIYGNDETVFEAPPYRIPSISLTRWPFVEYHTDQDTPEKLSEENLQDTVDTVLKICEGVEINKVYLPNFSGLVCLSRHNLYKPIPNIGDSGVDYNSNTGRWNQLMNGLPSCLDGDTDLLSISERYDLPFFEVAQYLDLWLEKNLLKEKDFKSN
jgi:aminopeptidase-like protein